MLTYLDGLEKDYPSLYKMTTPMGEAARDLITDVEKCGFEDTDVRKFRKFLFACTSFASVRDSFRIPEEDWRLSEKPINGRIVKMHPWYWSIFTAATRQISHVSFLLLSAKEGAFKSYAYDVARNGKLLGLPVLPLNVKGDYFYVNDGMISKTWVKSMLYMEMQFKFVGRVVHAKRLWRQAFPHGANRDLTRAYNNSHPTWWLDIAAEEIVSEIYPPIPVKGTKATREDVCPMPECADIFFSKFPGVAEPLKGDLKPFDYPKRSNADLVRDLMEWAHVYKMIGIGCDATDYTVIPANVTTYDFIVNPKQEYESMRIVGIVNKALPTCAPTERPHDWARGSIIGQNYKER